MFCICVIDQFLHLYHNPLSRTLYRMPDVKKSVHEYDKRNKTWLNSYQMLYNPSTNISPRAKGPLADIGASGLYSI